ncbi:hypothetical protein BDW71DRAFT_173576 [Aspergillus fruticulosus]
MLSLTVTQPPRLINSTTIRVLGSIIPRQFQPHKAFRSSPRSLFDAKRTLATMSNEFLCIVPDKPGAQAKRLEVRSKHLEGVKPLVEAGKVVVGGAMLNAHPSEGEMPSFKGSMLIVIGEKEEDAWEVIRNDVYTKSGVWDLDAAQVIPFKSAVRVGA